MKRAGLVCLIGVVVLFAGCRSDSPPGEQQDRDAAAGGKDGPTIAKDVGGASDSASAPGGDVLASGKDGQDGDALAGGGKDSQTADTPVNFPPDALPPAPADAAPEVSAKDAPEADASGRTDARADSIIASPVDLGTALEAGRAETAADATTDLATDSSAAVGFPCRNDSDCCIEIDGCMNTAYLYSVAPGAAPAPAIPPSTGRMCTACIPPPIQVRCVSGQCTGERISSYPGSLLSSHCGYINLPDAGATALADVIGDGGTPPTKSVWSCGG